MQTDNQVLQINIDDIIPNRFQPRIAFDDNGLAELAASIKEHGIIQPLVLRKLGKKYEIIAGERRYKASQLAGLTTVPAIISNIDDNKSAEVALVENIQRRDLTAIEEARSYKNLLDKGYLTQEQLAKKMGLSQSAISNKLRLLNLDDSVQQALLDNKISERHARSLLTLPNKEDQKKWLDKIINERLTVRQLDKALKDNNVETSDGSDVPLVELTPNIEEIQSNAEDINKEGINSPKVSEEIMIEENQPNTLDNQGIEISEDVQDTTQPMVSPVENTNTLDNNTPEQHDINENNNFEVNNNVGTDSFEPLNPFAGSDIVPNTTQSQVMPTQPNVNNNASRFFNQLEEQPVDMNSLNAFDGQNQFTIDNNPNQIPNNDIEIFDMSKNQAPQQDFNNDSINNQFNTMESNAINELNPNNRFFQPIQDSSVDNINPINIPTQQYINPMDSISLLQGNNFESNNVMDAIAEIKSKVNELTSKGYNINMDEADMNNTYHINIIINK